MWQMAFLKFVLAVFAALVPSFAYAIAVQFTWAEYPVPLLTRIDPTKDHYTVELVTGWLSKEGSFLNAIKGIIITNTKIAIFVEATRTYEVEDGLRNLSASYMLEHTDPPQLSGVSRSIGIFQQALLDNVAPDTTSRIKLQVLYHKDSRIAKILEELKRQGLGSVTAKPTVAVASAIAETIVKIIFDPTKPDEAVLGQFDVRTSDAIREGYLVAVAPESDNDDRAQQIIADGVVFQNNQLYNKRDMQKPITDRTYFVLRIRKAQSHDITVSAAKSYQPWAPLVTGIYRMKHTRDITEPTQINLAVKQLHSELDAISDLLKKDPEVSLYDLHTGLLHLMTLAVTQIASTCTRVSNSLQPCPTGTLETLRDQQQLLIERAFKNKPEIAKAIKEVADLATVHTLNKAFDVSEFHNMIASPEMNLKMEEAIRNSIVQMKAFQGATGGIAKGHDGLFQILKPGES